MEQIVIDAKIILCSRRINKDKEYKKQVNKYLKKHTEEIENLPNLVLEDTQIKEDSPAAQPDKNESQSVPRSVRKLRAGRNIK